MIVSADRPPPHPLPPPLLCTNMAPYPEPSPTVQPPGPQELIPHKW